MGKGRTGETVQDTGNARAKNSALPRFGSFARPIRAGFEPRRGVIPPKKTERPSILNEGSLSRRHDNGSKPARNSPKSNNPIGAPSFSPYRSWFKPAVSPRQTSNAERPYAPTILRT